jgi:hypothetical protein
MFCFSEQTEEAEKLLYNSFSDFHLFHPQASAVSGMIACPLAVSWRNIGLSARHSQI